MNLPFTYSPLSVRAQSSVRHHLRYEISSEPRLLNVARQVSTQCIVAVAIGTWGCLGVQGQFLPIRTTEVLAKQTIDNLEPGPDFLHFNTRQLIKPKVK